MGIFNSKLLIFDLDGTLIDSRKDIAIAVNHTLKEAGLKQLPEEKIYSFVGNGVDYLIEKSIGKSQMLRFDECKKNFMNYYGDHLVDNTTLYDGVLDMLQHFDDKIKCIISSKPTAFCKTIIDRFDLNKFFKEIHGSESFPALKPDPIGVKTLYKKFNVLQEECIFVGDGPQDINAAKNAGVKMAAVTYGFHSENRLKKENPDLLLDSIESLKNYITL